MRAPTLPLATARYRLLVEQLGSELNHRYGWKSEVARRLGVRPSYVAKILAGDIATVGQGVLDRAIGALRLSPEYFTDPGRPADYHASVADDSVDSSRPDSELLAMQQVASAFGGIDDAARARVLAWATARWGK